MKAFNDGVEIVGLVELLLSEMLLNLFGGLSPRGVERVEDGIFKFVRLWRGGGVEGEKFSSWASVWPVARLRFLPSWANVFACISPVGPVGPRLFTPRAVL
ncbi:hypothetical protein, partial [Corynebacterium parakroppenstedtii]|uniref:hypothetical protein n=1 Tax=Corynebacterium parakroppenstedtii TaxID=2828363 RepID=UPI001F3CAD88